MFTYHQATGLFEGNGLSFNGYSGFQAGKNNPNFQTQHDLGPIPQGLYKIQGPPFDTPTHGPFVLRLIPDPSNNMFGRSGFLIHGDSIRHPGMASYGCIILPFTVRSAIWQSDDKALTVVAY